MFRSTPTWFTQDSTTSSRRFLSACGDDVVLVLADADALGVDLHQLGQRVLQAARDRDGAAHGDVEVRELLARDLARAVHAGARLVHHDDGHVPMPSSLHGARAGTLSVSRPAVPLPTAMARIVACVEHLARASFLRLARLPSSVCEVDDVVRRYLPDVVDDRELAAGAQAGIDAEHRLRRRTARRGGACAGSRRRPRWPRSSATSLSARCTSLSIAGQHVPLSAERARALQQDAAPARVGHRAAPAAARRARQRAGRRRLRASVRRRRRCDSDSSSSIQPRRIAR